MKKFLVSLLIILFASMAWAIPPAPIPPIRANNCSAFIADGVMCYDTDDDKFYIGNGTAAVEFVSLSTSIFPAAGVPVYDTNSSHVLYLKAGSDITANKNLTFTTGDSDRTITLSGNPTLADWFDQAVKAASAVTFATVDTGQGANELYDMDQNVLTSSTPQFAGLTLSTDAILSRKGAANFQLGAADAASAVAQTLTVQSVVAGTTDIAGANLTIIGSMGTGTGAGGSIIFQTSPAAAGSASTQNAPVTALTIGPTGRHTITTTDDYGLVFGSLGTATRGIDFSGSGLSGDDYLLYFSANLYLKMSGFLVCDILSAQNYIQGTYLFGDNGLKIETVAGKDIRLKTTAFSSFVVGNETAVGSLTACSSDGTTTITKTTHGLTLAAGELVHVTDSSTAADKGFYRIVSSGVSTIVVDRALSGTQTDVALTVYKDVISIHATDATNGQMLTSWSAQNKPMQLGGTVLAATANSLTSTDVVMGGMTEFMGSTFFKAGTSTGYSTPVGAINVNTTAVGNTDGGEDVLMTYSLPLNALSANAKGLRVTVYGTIANNANAKTVKVYFGTTAVYTDSMTVNQAYNWTGQYTAIRTGTDTQDVFGTGFVENIAMTVAPYYATDTQDDGAAIVIKCTGEGVASNDIIQQGMLVEYIN